MPFLGEADGSLVLLADDWYAPYLQEMNTEMNEAVQRVETYATNISDAVDENTVLHRVELETVTTTLLTTEVAKQADSVFVVAADMSTCPEGYTHATEYDTCLMARKHFNKTGHSGIRMLTDTSWSDAGFMGGCFFRNRTDSHNILHFNHREASGIPENGVMMVCKRS